MAGSVQRDEILLASEAVFFFAFSYKVQVAKRERDAKATPVCFRDLASGV